MAQHDYNISNQSGAAFRQDLNNALAAIVSNNSGAVEPSTTYAYQFWADTTAGVLKQRNAANSAWVTLFQLDGEWTTIALENGTGAAPSLYFKDSGTDTGLYSPGTDQVGISTGGIQRVNFNGSTEVVFNDTGADVDFRIEGDTEPDLFVIDAGTDQVRVKNLNGGPLAGSRNRIINGDMRIDQRNSGAAVTPTTGQYSVDRWRGTLAAVSKFSLQQNAGAVTPPPGFTNYLGATSLSAYAVTGNDYFLIEQAIEGFNVADLNWGTANAVPATLSFWVRSSLTGTFGGSLATTKTTIWVLPFTYTIASANTWTYITVSIPAPTATAGTNNDNTDGIFVRFGLGAAGASAGGTAGTWTSAGNYFQPSGTVSVVGTNGATLYLTGVQLEPGTVATPFERRSYGQELALCQRYYQQGFMRNNVGNSLTYAGLSNLLTVVMRASPTATFKDAVGNASKLSTNTGDNIGISSGSLVATTGSVYLDVLTTSNLSNWWYCQFFLSAEL